MSRCASRSEPPGPGREGARRRGRGAGPAPAAAAALALLALGLLAPGCGGGWSGEAGAPPWEASVYARLDSAGTERAVVEVAIPYRSLVFRRGGEGYRSRLLVTVVARQDGRRTAGAVRETTLAVAGHARTRSPRRLRLEVPLPLPSTRPAELEVTASVAGTERSWRRRLEHEPGLASRLPLHLGGLEWNLEPDPALGPVLSAGRDSLRLRVSLGRRPGGGGAGPLRLLARLDQGERRAAERETALPAAGGPTVTARLAWAARDLPFGDLRLSLALERGEGREAERFGLDRPRRLVNLNPPLADDAAWTRQLGWLRGVVPDSLRHRLAAAGDDEPAARRRAWDRLWREAAAAAGDPAAAAELERRHLLRIVEADRRYGGPGRGADSDRGRIFVRHGPPDQVRRFADDLFGEGRWEVWLYAGPRLRFAFHDPHGLDDWRLRERTSY